MAEWVMDEYRTWWLHMVGPDGREVAAWVAARNSYCDRGHWQACVEGIPSIDSADSFPRFYMRFEVAKQEMREFLMWRLFKIRAEPYGEPLNPIEVIIAAGEKK